MKPLTALAAVALAALPLTACAAHLSSAPAPASAGADATVRALEPAVPDTASAARSAAVRYLSLYSAGQWQAAWPLLASQARRLAPESLWAAFHQECPPQSAGMAYDVEGVTMAGRNAVITYTIPVLKKVYGSAADAMEWTPEGWRVEFDSVAVAQYGHGSLKADVAAAKAAGDCG